MWLGFRSESDFIMISTCLVAPMVLLSRKPLYALMKPLEHDFGRGFFANVKRRVPGQLRPELIVVQHFEHSLLECGQRPAGDDKSVSAMLQIGDFRWVVPLLSNHRQAPVERLVEPQADVARNGA